MLSWWKSLVVKNHSPIKSSYTYKCTYIPIFTNRYNVYAHTDKFIDTNFADMQTHRWVNPHTHIQAHIHILQILHKYCYRPFILESITLLNICISHTLSKTSITKRTQMIAVGYDHWPLHSGNPSISLYGITTLSSLESSSSTIPPNPDPQMIPSTGLISVLFLKKWATSCISSYSICSSFGSGLEKKHKAITRLIALYVCPEVNVRQSSCYTQVY